MDKSNKLKDDDKAGLFYAKDSAGRLIPAKDSVHGKDYRCPVCGCNVYPKTLPSGTPIYARKPGQMHMNPICYTMEQKRTEKSFDGLDPEKFITTLCHAVPHKKTPGPDIPPNEEEKSPRPSVDTGDEAKLSSFTSLKQISESGIPFLNAYDMHGNHYVSDFIMTYKFGEQFFSDPNFTLGARIVYARFAWIDWGSKALVFSMFNENFSIRFRLVFLQASKKDFKKIWEKIGKFEEDEKGKSHFVKYNDRQDFLIASDDWTYISREQCTSLCSSDEKYCTKCKGMYQAIFTSSKQIYMLPE